MSTSLPLGLIGKIALTTDHFTPSYATSSPSPGDGNSDISLSCLKIHSKDSRILTFIFRGKYYEKECDFNNTLNNINNLVSYTAATTNKFSFFTKKNTNKNKTTDQLNTSGREKGKIIR